MMKLEISGVHIKLTAEERDYIEHKIGHLRPPTTGPRSKKVFMAG